MKIKDLDQIQEVKDLLYSFARKPEGFLLISGKNGTGKSTAAMAVYNFVTPFRLPAFDHDIAYFISQAELNFLWQKNLSDWGNTFYLLEELMKTKLLVLDDLGTKNPTDTFNDFLYAIADHRYNARANCGTVITTNLGSKGIREIFGDAFFSRVASGLRLSMEGKDRRFDALNSNGNDPSLNQNIKKVL